METKKIRVIVADDFPLYLEAICKVIKSYNELELIDKVLNGKELIQSFIVNHPDLVITDCRMPVMTGFEACQEILKINNNAKVLFISQDRDDVNIYMVYKSGGLGLLQKDKVVAEFQGAIQKVMNGKRFFGEIDPDKKILELESLFGINAVDG